MPQKTIVLELTEEELSIIALSTGLVLSRILPNDDIMSEKYQEMAAQLLHVAIIKWPEAVGEIRRKLLGTFERLGKEADEDKTDGGSSLHLAE